MHFILRLLLILTIGYIVYKVLWKGKPLFRSKPKQHKPHPQKPLEEMKKDPICGTYIPENQAIKYKAGGEIHYFCSEECKNKFRQLQEK
ncbi:MAG: YHS domain-containing protein [Candidatus Aminicenantes bacterium]|jgi:YHS domain-containing protein